MKSLLLMIFGSAVSQKRYLWYALLLVLAIVALGCVRGCSIAEWGVRSLSALLACLILALAYFFLDLPGKDILRTRIYIYRLVKRLEPAARIAGATCSVRTHSQRGTTLLSYEFPSGERLTLEAWIEGFNIYAEAPTTEQAASKHFQDFSTEVEGLRK